MIALILMKQQKEIRTSKMSGQCRRWRNSWKPEVVPDIGDACGDFDDDDDGAVGKAFWLLAGVKQKGVRGMRPKLVTVSGEWLKWGKADMGGWVAAPQKIHMQPEHEFRENELESIIFMWVTWWNFPS